MLSWVTRFGGLYLSTGLNEVLCCFPFTSLPANEGSTCAGDRCSNLDLPSTLDFTFSIPALISDRLSTSPGIRLRIGSRIGSSICLARSMLMMGCLLKLWPCWLSATGCGGCTVAVGCEAVVRDWPTWKNLNRSAYTCKVTCELTMHNHQLLCLCMHARTYTCMYANSRLIVWSYPKLLYSRVNFHPPELK